MGFDIIGKMYALPALLIAITFHELAHGYSAFLLGDNTAKDHGRLTLNPLKHIDIVGFLLLLTVGFGWAKPVPINPLKFKNRKGGTIIVSLAGPITNFLLVILSATILGVLISNGVKVNNFVITLLQLSIAYNLVLGIFNLLPFPPLDGSKILASLLPTELEMMFYKYERYFYLILVLLIITNTIDKILGPLIDLGYDYLMMIINVIFWYKNDYRY